MFEFIGMPLVHHSDEEKYVRPLYDWLQKCTDSGKQNLSCFRLRKPCISYCFVKVAEELKQKLFSEMRQRTKDHGFFVECHNFELFAVPPAKRLRFYAPLRVFLNEIKNCPLLCVSSSLQSENYSNVLFGDDDCNRNTHRIQRTVTLEFVILTLNASFWTGCPAIITRHHGRCLQQEREDRA